jgi:hypothetical protein
MRIRIPDYWALADFISSDKDQYIQKTKFRSLRGSKGGCGRPWTLKMEGWRLKIGGLEGL